MLNFRAIHLTTKVESVLSIFNKTQQTINKYTKELEKKGFIKKVSSRPLRYEIESWIAEKF